MLDWELLERIDPWGQRREDFHAATICWTIYHANCKTPPEFEKVLEYFDFDKAYREQSDEQMSRVFDKLARLGRDRN